MSCIGQVHGEKDFLVGIGNISGFTNICEGDVDWAGVRKALSDIGYDDVVTAEIGGYRTLPELGIRHAGESLKRIFRARGGSDLGSPGGGTSVDKILEGEA